MICAILLAYPAGSRRRRLVRVALGLAGLALLKAVGVGLALLAPFAQAEAVIRGAKTPMFLEIWPRVMQAGGGFAMAAAIALLIVAVTRPQSAGSVETEPTVPCRARRAR